jgi:hypothetical protein
MNGSTIGQKEESTLPPLVTVTPPDDLNKEQWKIEATEKTSGTENYVAYCDAGFYTADEADGTYFYIQGLCPESPEIWVKAPLKDGKVVIPASTYFSNTSIMNPETYEYFMVQLFLTSATTTGALTDVVFNYDEEKGKLVSTQPIFINANRRELAILHYYDGMTITHIPDVAATPADPAFAKEGGLDLVDTWSTKIHAVINSVDVNGNERNVSNIVWAENPAYDGATGIASMTNDESHKTGDIFDLQGRCVDTPTHGLYIVNGKKVWVK